MTNIKLFFRTIIIIFINVGKHGAILIIIEFRYHRFDYTNCLPPSKLQTFVLLHSVK